MELLSDPQFWAKWRSIVLLSLPMVVWSSGLLAGLMNRFPVIIWLGDGVLGWVAVKMMLDDPWVNGRWGAELARHPHQAAPMVLGVAIAALGSWFARRPMARGLEV